MPGRHHSTPPAYQYHKSAPAPATTLRPCLGPLCRGRKVFRSQHPGHRMCGRCHSKVEEITRGVSPQALLATVGVPGEVGELT